MDRKEVKTIITKMVGFKFKKEQEEKLKIKRKDDFIFIFLSFYNNIYPVQVMIYPFNNKSYTNICKYVEV